MFVCCRMLYVLKTMLFGRLEMLVKESIVILASQKTA